MSKINRQVGATSQILQVFVRDSSSPTGGGLTGLAFNTASLTAYYHRDTDTTATAISLVTMTVGTFTSSGFKEIDATNMPGWYQFCPPNAAFASGAASVGFHLKGASNMAPLPIECDLDAQSDVRLWNGTAVASPATAGIPDVNVKNINNVSASSVTTVSANQGTTQPINFTGTGASALVKSDMVDIAGAAVSTGTAQIGVNAVNLGGTAQTGRDIGASVLLSAGTGTGQLDFTSGVVKANLVQILATALTETAGQIAGAFKQFFNISSPTGTVNLIPAVTTVTTTTTATNLTNAPTNGDFTAAMKTSLNAATPASVVGSVGSVTGNVGGNVVGAVGSVTAAVSITAGAVQSIWDALTSALTTAGSIGKLLAALPGSIWDVVLSGHTTTGTTGAALNSASSAGDPWATALPGSYTSGQAGNIVGNNLNATVSSRAIPGDAMALTSGERTTLAGVIWANASRTLTSFGTLVADVATAVWAAGARTLTAFGFTVTTDISSLVTTNLDTTVSSRLPTSSYTTPPTAASNADTLLGRNLAGGANGGRTVQDALRPARNKVIISSGTLTVYEEDDTTPAWTAAMTTDPAAEPIVEMDPA